MSNHLKFYIDGAWVDPVTPRKLDVINPATEEPFTAISIGSAADVDRAVAAARAAFPKFSQTGKAERVALLKRIIECYRARMEDIAQAVSAEMGAPIIMATTKARASVSPWPRISSTARRRCEGRPAARSASAAMRSSSAMMRLSTARCRLTSLIPSNRPTARSRFGRTEYGSGGEGVDRFW